MAMRAIHSGGEGSSDGGGGDGGGDGGGIATRASRRNGDGNRIRRRASPSRRDLADEKWRRVLPASGGRFARSCCMFVRASARP